VAVRIRNKTFDAGLHHHHVLYPPQGNDRELERERLLHPAVYLPSLFEIETPPPRFEQPVELGIAITAPVVALGRKAPRMEKREIDVRVDGADPGERIKMEVSFANVAVKSAPFVGAHLQLDSHPAELFLEGLAEKPGRPRNQGQAFFYY